MTASFAENLCSSTSVNTQVYLFSLWDFLYRRSHILRKVERNIKKKLPFLISQLLRPRHLDREVGTSINLVIRKEMADIIIRKRPKTHTKKTQKKFNWKLPHHLWYCKSEYVWFQKASSFRLCRFLKFVSIFSCDQLGCVRFSRNLNLNT